jgi:hypothetical protein
MSREAFSALQIAPGAAIGASKRQVKRQGLVHASLSGVKGRRALTLLGFLKWVKNASLVDSSHSFHNMSHLFTKNLPKKQIVGTEDAVMRQP